MKRAFCFIGFSSAVTLLILNIVDYKYSKYLLISAAVLFAASLLIKKIRQANAVPIVLGTALFSCLIFVFVCNNTLFPQLKLDGASCDVVFNIVDAAKKTDSGYKYVIMTKSIDRENTVQNIKLVLKTNNKLEADYYDDISANIKFKSVSDKPFESFGSYGDEIFLSASLYGEYAVSKTAHKPIKYYVIKSRERLKSNLLNTLDEDSGNLAVSLLIGDTSGLSNEIKSNFKICAATHLMAVSGIHTSVICLGFYLLLRRIGAPNIPAVVASLLLLLYYIGVADYSKSVIRAGVMITVLLVSKLVNRKADLLNSLGFATFILCLNPFAVTDPSAVLTVCAVLGIAVIKPKIDAFLKFETKAKEKTKAKDSFISYIANSVTLTISVILSTLPAVWLYFKSISFLGLLLNIVLVFLAQLTIIAALVLSLMSCVPVISTVISTIVLILTGAMNKITEFFAKHFSFLFVDISNEIFCAAIALCIAFCGLSLIITNKIRLKHIYPFMLVVFLLSSVLSIHSFNTSSYLNVTSGGCVIAWDKDSAVIVGADDGNDYYELRNVIGNKPLRNVVYINCNYSEKRLKELTDCGSRIFKDEYLDIDLCDNISVKYNGVEMLIRIYDNKIAVSNDCVKVNDYLAYRDVYGKFSDERGYSFSFTDNNEFQLRREGNG